MNALKPACPQCGTMVTMDDSNPWRPFCSERCRLLDLGAWLKGDHHIPGEETDSLPEQGPDTDEPTRH